MPQRLAPQALEGVNNFISGLGQDILIHPVSPVHT